MRSVEHFALGVAHDQQVLKVALPADGRGPHRSASQPQGQRSLCARCCTACLLQVVYEELRELMGGAQAELTLPKYGPAVILMAGLQGTGKTTAAGKLALFLKKKGLKVLLVATDVYRPGTGCTAGVGLDGGGGGALLVLGAAAAVRTVATATAAAAAAWLLLCGGHNPCSALLANCRLPPCLPPLAAAIDQLVTLGGKIDVPVFELGTGVAPPEIAR